MGNASLRILHVVESLDRGGLERLVVDLVTEQVRRGHQVGVATLYRPGPLAAELQDAGVVVVDCNKAGAGGLHAFRHLRRRLRQGVDVMHSHNPMSHYYAVAAAFGLPRTMRINTRHGMGPDGTVSKRLEWLYACSLARTDAVAVVCDAARQRFIRGRIANRFPGITVHNGIDLSRVEERSESRRLQLLAELERPASSCIIGCVGRLDPVKQHRVLLEAVARVLPTCPDACVVLVGDGPEHAGLARLAAELGIADSVHFLGARTDVPRLLAGMDVFALTSASEGYSLALVEASAAGLPIVASAVGGTAEIIANGVTGHLFPANDVDSCATFLRALATSPELRNRMGAQARCWALEHASLQKMADAYEILYANQARSHVHGQRGSSPADRGGIA